MLAELAMVKGAVQVYPKIYNLHILNYMVPLKWENGLEVAFSGLNLDKLYVCLHIILRSI